MSDIQERYHASAMAANGAYPITGSAVGGFICVTAGTITITRSTGTVVLNALPVSAGVYYPLPMYIGNNGGVAQLAGGASGTILV